MIEALSMCDAGIIIVTFVSGVAAGILGVVLLIVAAIKSNTPDA